MNKALFAVFAALFFAFARADAASALEDESAMSDVKSDVDTLSLRLDKLEQKVNAPQIRPNLFNPGITAFGNFLTCIGQGYPESAHGLCEKPFAIREVELDIRAAVDPWADAVLILAFEPGHSHDHDEGDSFQVEIEEAYITLKQLPILNEAPWGMQFKAGRFRVPFGRFNQIHLHDLPQMTLPSSLQAFLGPHGLIRNGFSNQFLVPTPGDNNSLSLTLQILTGGGLPYDSVNETRWPSGLAHLAWFWDLAEEHDLEVGLSAYVEGNPARAARPVQLYGTDISYKWRPYVFGEKHSFLLAGEAYLAPKEINNNTVWGIGGFAWAQYQFNQWTYLGARYDYRNLQDRGHGVGAFLTYYTTEFLRLRAGYEVVADSGFTNARNNFLFEINFVFGSHPVEPYWVNR